MENLENSANIYPKIKFWIFWIIFYGLVVAVLQYDISNDWEGWNPFGLGAVAIGFTIFMSPLLIFLGILPLFVGGFRMRKFFKVGLVVGCMVPFIYLIFLYVWGSL